MATSQQLIRWPHFPFVHGEPLVEAVPSDSEAAKYAIGDEKQQPSNDPLKLNNWIASVEVICSAHGRGKIWLGDAQGRVCAFNRQLVLDLLLQAYAPDGQILHVATVKQHPFLYTVGTDEGTPSAVPILKIWNLDKLDKSRMPFLIRPVKLQFEGDSVPVTAFAVSENLCHIAVGLLNGLVLLFKGDLTRDRYMKQRFINEELRDKGRVTGLFFKDALNDVNNMVERDQLRNFLTIVTETGVVGYHLYARSESVAFVDRIWGANAGCSTLDDRSNVVIARPESLVSYTADGRGPLWVLDGEKAGLRWYRTYAVIWLSKKDTSASKFTGNLLIVDVRNKFVVYTKEISSPIAWIEGEWNQLLCVTQDRQILQIQELDLVSRLKMLYQKNLYSMAVKLAESSMQSGAVEIESDMVATIYQKYADYLHSKGDYDGSMQQYIQTIGTLEPSYVIRRFLDAQRIQNLTLYLQALHTRALATADHTTLLLNCYTKQRDIAKLDEFIRSDSELYFDVKIVIEVCRQAGFFDHGAYLAKKFEEHEAYIAIQLENLKNYEEAMEYVSKLGFLEAERIMKLHGKVLVDNLSLDASRFLLKLCVGKLGENLRGLDPKQKPMFVSNPRDFIHIFVDQKLSLVAFLEEYVAQSPDAVDIGIWNTLLELYLTVGADVLKIPKLAMETTVPQTSASLRFSAHSDPVVALLKSSFAKYDPDQALLLCRVHNHVAGLLFLYEKLHLYQEMLTYFMTVRDFENLWNACTKFGHVDRELWVKVLSFFASQPDGCHQELEACLRMIEAHNLLAPLRVIEILAQNSAVEFSIVKDYVLRKIQKQNNGMLADREMIRGYQEEITKMQREIEDAQSRPQIFQASKCNSCSLPLDLPAVHFLCRHSYHLRCLGANEQQCPKCYPDMVSLAELQQNQALSAFDHDQFFQKLNAAEDTFGVISEYYGRNVFSAFQRKT